MGTGAIWSQVGAMAASKLAMFGMIYMTQKLGTDSAAAAGLIGAVAGAVMGLAVALQILDITKQTKGWGLLGAMAIGAIAMGLFNAMMYKSMNQPPKDFAGYTEPIGEGAFGPEHRAYGGPVYPKMARGGGVSSQPYMVGEKGPELFMPHTSGNIIPNNEVTGGVTINISGDVYDGDNFADKIGQVLPNALRGLDDRGAI